MLKNKRTIVSISNIIRYSVFCVVNPILKEKKQNCYYNCTPCKIFIIFFIRWKKTNAKYAPKAKDAKVYIWLR